eukprot:jgi/Astpho2/8328/Aster-x0354
MLDQHVALLPVERWKGCRQRMLWFTAQSSYTPLDKDYWRYAQAAVLSAQENSPNLVPVLIFADQQPESDANTYHDMLNWFREHGCLVYHHRLTFLKDIQAVAGQPSERNEARGHEDYHLYVENIYARLDLPTIVPELLKQLGKSHPDLAGVINKDYVSSVLQFLASVLPLWSLELCLAIKNYYCTKQYVLYTDVDVMFWSTFDPCTVDRPAVIALTPEVNHRGDEFNTFNSGVMLMNISGMAAEWPALKAFGNNHGWDFPAFEQSMLNEYYGFGAGSKIVTLPDRFNWKGYWGSSASIVLTHAHGPKPERCLDCYVLARDEWRLDRLKEDCPCFEVYADIYLMAPDEGRLYKEMMMAYAGYMDKAKHQNASVSVSGSV